MGEKGKLTMLEANNLGNMNQSINASISAYEEAEKHAPNNSPGGNGGQPHAAAADSQSVTLLIDLSDSMKDRIVTAREQILKAWNGWKAGSKIPWNVITFNTKVIKFPGKYWTRH